MPSLIGTGTPPGLLTLLRKTSSTFQQTKRLQLQKFIGCAKNCFGFCGRIHKLIESHSKLKNTARGLRALRLVKLHIMMLPPLLSQVKSHCP